MGTGTHKPHSILAVDGGTVTGWAHWREGMQKPRAGTLHLPENENMGIWGHALVEWMVPFIRENQVTLVHIEKPIIHLHRQEDSGRVRTNIHEITKGQAVASFSRYAAYIEGVQSELIPRPSACKHFAGIGAGKRRDLKAACFVAAQAKGWAIKSQDAADALAILDFACWTLKQKTPWDCRPLPGPLFTAEAAKGIQLPANSAKVSARLLNKALSFDAGKG